MAAKRTPEPILKMRVVPPGTPEHLDKTLRFEARRFDSAWERLEPLIIEAREREIHKTLGFKSWPEYIADVARREMPNVSRSVEQRRELVALLAGEGMSQRAIADAVGASQSTVRDDVAELSKNYSVVLPDKVIGLDNKERPTHPAKPKPKPTPKPQPEPKPEPPELDADGLDWSKVPASFRAKLKAVHKREWNRLKKQFDAAVDAQVRRERLAVKAEVERRLRSWLKAAEDTADELHRLRQHNRVGVFSEDEIGLIVRCLHPDNSASEETRKKAFQVFNGAKIALRKPGVGIKDRVKLPDLDDLIDHRSKR